MDEFKLLMLVMCCVLNRISNRDVPDSNFDQIPDTTGFGRRPDSDTKYKKFSVVLSQLCSDHLNQLVDAVNVIELPCCCLFSRLHASASCCNGLHGFDRKRAFLDSR